MEFGLNRVVLAVFLMFLGSAVGSALAQETDTLPAPEALPGVEGIVTTAPPDSNYELTLEKVIEHGGPVLWVIIGLGFVAVVLAVYLFLTVTPRREAPTKLMRRATNLIRTGDLDGALRLCQEREELIARVLHSGLKMSNHERYIIQESMESEGQRGAAELWQRISYLNNIGVIAPLLGLLGTVWGMIGAFSAIAMDSSRVRDLTMASNVSQAMITTAAGLLLAIPALMVYYFLRGRVLKVIALVESHASEFVELIIRNRSR